MNYDDWVEELTAEEKAHGEWRKKAKKVRELYRLKEDKGVKFNIFKANVEVLSASVYSNTPNPDVRRRYKDDNPPAKQVAEMLERALAFSLDSYDFDSVMTHCIEDYLVPALGQVRVNYKPYLVENGREQVPLEMREEYAPVEEGQPEEVTTRYFDGDEEVTNPLFDEMDQPYREGNPLYEIAYQAVDCSVVPWDCFHFSPAKDWESVWWVGETHYLTEDEIDEKFGPGHDLPFDYSDEGKRSEEGKGTRAKVCEVWDKKEREHFAICIGCQKRLWFVDDSGNEIKDDELGLSNFWPYPRPLMANTSSGDLIPMPDYCYYQDQVQELNEISDRIENLTKYLKYRGVYDSSFENDSGVAVLSQVANGADGTFEPVPGLAQLLASLGAKDLSGVIGTLPLGEILTVLQALVEMRDQIKQTIYEVTGIADIVRGSTKASETLGAQQLKGQFANMRLSRKQKDVERFVRDIFRIQAEIIAEHFEPEVLELMTGKSVTTEMVEIMRSDVLREFSVDVETDSTILADQAEEQENRTEATRALVELWSAMLPMVQQGLPMQVAKETSLFLVRGFKAGRQLEDVINQLPDNQGAGPAIPGMGGPGTPGAVPGAQPNAGAAPQGAADMRGRVQPPSAA